MRVTAEPAPFEVDADALGERLAEVRLLRGADVEMAASLRRYGQLSPLLCYRGEAGALEVLDGFRRLRTAQQYGFPHRLRVQVLPLDERGALAALVSLHRGTAGLSELEQALVVRALVREQHMAQAEVAQLLGRDPSWVSRRLLLVESLCPEVQIDVRLGLVPITAARDIARLPRGTQSAAAQAIAAQHLSVREAGRLCGALLTAGARDGDDVERLLGESVSPALEPPEVASWRSALGSLSSAAMRVGRRLAEQPPSSLGASKAELVRTLLVAVRGTLGLLLALMDHHLETTP
jgi:ParB-like chromosome segregation protein Spo0J